MFFISGVSRPSVTSLFTPNVRYIEVTEEGYVGDLVVPPHYTGTVEDLAQVRSNAARSGQVGSLIANDLRSALVRADLQDSDARTGEAVSYAAVAAELEAIRDRYASDSIEIHIVGFAKLVGDVIDGLSTVIGFFVVAFFITAALLWIYTRSLKLTVVALIGAAAGDLVARAAAVAGAGHRPDVDSGTLPDLLHRRFHAVQMTNAWKQDVLQGCDSISAARSAFCKIFIPGALALLMNALGFAVIMLIDIPIVHELGITACIGVMLMIITNKMMLPIIISHLSRRPVHVRAAGRLRLDDTHCGGGPHWRCQGQRWRCSPAVSCCWALV